MDTINHLVLYVTYFVINNERSNSFCVCEMVDFNHCITIWSVHVFGFDEYVDINIEHSSILHIFHFVTIIII